MRSFDYRFLADRPWSMQTVQNMGAVHEHKGRQALYLRSKPQALETLLQAAKIQSVDASNRLEGISTTNERLKDLINDKTTPRNRSEQEIAGYRKVLSLIHESHDAIPVTPNVLLQLHRDLFSQVPGAPSGHFKNVQNYIEEQHPDGRRIIRFKPLAPADTPAAMQAICDSFGSVRESGTVDELLLIPAFVLDFLSIHPFADGNGRMGRLLLALLLYQSDYIVGKYISLEKLVQKSAAQYYEVLRACNDGWHNATNDPTPFIDYTLGILLEAYRTFEDRLSLADTTQRAYEVVRAVSAERTGKFAMRDLVEALPALSRASIEKSVRRLTEEGVLVRSGAGRGTKYQYNG